MLRIENNKIMKIVPVIFDLLLIFTYPNNNNI